MLSGVHGLRAEKGDSSKMTNRKCAHYDLSQVEHSNNGYFLLNTVAVKKCVSE